MIPKKIHWCWLSNDPLPKFIETCVNTWKIHLPDYEIKLWNMDNFDVNSVPYVAEAVKARKWAFACDYIRAYALYTEGGVYMDSDIFVRKNFDFALNNRAFSALELYPEELKYAIKHKIVDENGNKNPEVRYVHGSQIQAAFLGAEKCHPFFKDVMEYYNTHSFIKEDGTVDTEMISPFIYSNIAVKYGFKFTDKEQQLEEGFKIYGTNLCAPMPSVANGNSYTVHCCKHSWAVKDNAFINRTYKKFKVFVCKLLGRYVDSDAETIKQIQRLS